MLYTVQLAPAAQRELRRLPPQIRVRLAAPIQALSDSPRPPGVRKVQGKERTWRNRVGPYRVIYDLYDNEHLVVVLKVDRRRESTYRL